MWFMYGLLIYLFILLIRISSLWNPKSSEWIAGRKNWKKSLQPFDKKSKARIWFHVSSLGEFEQAKPVIEAINHKRPDVQVFLSFFSPSGYKPKKDYPHATVLYLPPDLPGNAAFFLKYVQPDAAVFVKYDLWPGFLRQLYHRKVPSFLISAHWQPNARFRSWTNPLTREYLKFFKKIFQQRKVDMAFFERLGFTNLIVAGDTRIDRSIHLANETGRIPDALKEKTFDLVAGSTWPADEELIIPIIRRLGLKAIIAPHGVSKANIKRLATLIKDNFQLLSDLKKDTFEADILIIDSIGLLSVLYAKGRIAYVGGGFGKGIHNILEPAAHGKPVIFGPGHDKFPEGRDLINAKAAFSVDNQSTFKEILEDILIPSKAKDAGDRALKYLYDHKGATALVSKYILESIPYTVKE